MAAKPTQVEPVSRSEAAPAIGESANPGPLGIICGGGAFPIAVARAAQAAGRPVVLFALRGSAGQEVEAFPHVWIPMGRFGFLQAELKRHGCREVVMIGNVMRPRIRDIRLDWATLKRMPRVLRMFRGGDDHLLTGVARLFEEAGFRLLGAHEVAPSILAPEGVLGRVQPRHEERDDARIGMRALHVLGPLDIGQGLVVMSGHVVAVEAAEGTDLMLERCADLRQRGRIKAPNPCGVLVKRPKEGQDRRLDLPSLGPQTVQGVAKAGIAGIAIEAGGVIVSEFEELVRQADEAGIFLLGVPADVDETA
ncbi:UDP-2,3-diacylglucosamine diphosphatase LpxI [Ancylobacter sp. 6x-1]|uniref:UDP-2,3-diacylglucosamine diphosphatase LpxI n=1 Tax=Ancylobacter crimeensis TaxID=2579147 RepID=A0ABT0D6T8_9HYPH|nr:UDP-2,3-diacylglucosamine diphosphatase LpxI [Ancylobacter crimeensis]MCK0195656.1 UDP-2,3-diacylglucosamine diphosphatase LpxI [Ancylobacter crimeensis]